MNGLILKGYKMKNFFKRLEENPLAELVSIVALVAALGVSLFFGQPL